MRNRPWLVAVLALVIALLFLRAAVAAQESPIKVGEQVRVWTTQSRIATYGTLTRWEPDSFAITETWIPRTSLTRIEISRLNSNAGKYAGLGLLGGAGAGAYFGFAICNFHGFPGWSAMLECGAIGALLGVPGFLLGTTVGLIVKTDRWEEVPLDQLPVSLLPQQVRVTAPDLG